MKEQEKCSLTTVGIVPPHYTVQVPEGRLATAALALALFTLN